MSKSIAVDNTKIKGICCNGVAYPLDRDCTITSSGHIDLETTVTGSINTAQTKGYLQTFSVDNSQQFELYSCTNVANKLTSIPSGYKFVYINADVRVVINDLTLVYDGNGLFHIAGSIPSQYSTAYDTDKTGLDSSYGIFLLDSNNRLMWKTSKYSAPLSQSGTSTATSINYNSSTLTLGQDTFTWGPSVYNEQLPLKIGTEAIYKPGEPGVFPNRFNEISTRKFSTGTGFNTAIADNIIITY